MADTLREVAQEAVVRGEQAPRTRYRTEHGKQVAGALRAEADKDVFTTLQIAAGEQVSPAILRANIDVAIGILKADGTIDRPAGTAYEKRHKRAVRAVKDAEKYFDDQTSFTEFAASAEGKRVIASTGKFLITHPALAEYFAALPQADRANASKALAEKYLQDPFAREKVRQALLESQLNQGDVADEFSEVARKKDELEAKLAALQAKQKKIEGDTGPPVVVGELQRLRERRREFDRFSDDARTVPGSEFTALQTAKSDRDTLDADIRAIDADVAAARIAVQALRAEMSALQTSRRSAAFTAVRTETDILADITTKETEVTTKLASKQAKEVAKAAKQAEIDAIEAERNQVEEEMRRKEEELKETKQSAAAVKSERDENVLKLARLEAAKGRSEELAVAEIENIFKKGIEQELTERLERAKEAADKALEESAAKAKDVDEKQYRELRAKRHKTPEGRVDGRAINEDFRAMMRDSAEYHVVRNTDNSVHIYVKNNAGNWNAVSSGAPALGTTPPAGNTVFYLTGPELAMLQMMNNTNEFGADFMLGKLKDAEWMQGESQAFAIQTLQDKMYASRGMLQRFRTGVKRLNSREVSKIKNSTWGMSALEQALEQNKDHVKAMDEVMKSDILQGPGSWREKIGRMSNKQLALLILGLTAGGAMLGPLAWPALTGAGAAVGGLKLTTAAGGLVGAGAGATAAGVGRSRGS